MAQKQTELAPLRRLLAAKKENNERLQDSQNDASSSIFL